MHNPLTNKLLDNTLTGDKLNAIVSHQIAESFIDPRQGRIQLKTNSACWLIPHNRKVLKALLHQEKIKPQDLCFQSPDACHQFTRMVLLLATSDYLTDPTGSLLTKFAQELVLLNQLH